MNLTTKSQAATMTSREIAELTGKRHFHVTADIEKMLLELSEDATAFRGIYLDSMNRQQTEYHLDRELTETLLTGYSAVLRRKVIARWRELEAAPQFSIPQTYSQAMRLAADQADQIEAQQAPLALAAPKVAFVDKYVESTGLKGFREVAKPLKASEPRFREFLVAEKIMYRLGGEWAAYAQHIDIGRFEVKTGTSEASQHAFTRTMFTGKGVEWVAGLWAVHCLRGEVAA